MKEHLGVGHVWLIAALWYPCADSCGWKVGQIRKDSDLVVSKDHRDSQKVHLVEIANVSQAVLSRPTWCTWLKHIQTYANIVEVF